MTMTMTTRPGRDDDPPYDPKGDIEIIEHLLQFDDVAEDELLPKTNPGGSGYDDEDDEEE